MCQEIYRVERFRILHSEILYPTATPDTYNTHTEERSEITPIAMVVTRTKTALLTQGKGT